MTSLVFSAASGGPSPLWYLSRGTGIVALILLTGSVLLGILEGIRWSPRRWPRFTLPLLHRDVSLLALSFIVVHVATVVLDGFAPIGWSDAVIPFVSQYRAVWLGLGTVGFDVLLAVLITSLLRRRFSYGAWRAVHWLAYGSWATALLHGLGTGSDTKTVWILGLEGLCVALVIAAVLWRLRPAFSHLPSVRISGRIAAVLAPVVLIVWVVAGPLQPGWARHAGTPSSLLVKAAAASDQRGSDTTELTAPFHAALSGTVGQSASQSAGGTTLEFDMTLSGGATGTMRVTLTGTSSPDGGLNIQSSAVRLSGSSDQAIYTGQVRGVAGNTLTATVTAPGLPAMNLSIQLNVGVGNTVSGTVQGSAATGAEGL